MRRSTLALGSSLAAIGLSATIALAQQSSRAPATGGSPTSSDESADPSMAGRPTRYLLRNGLDYLAYREYARALTFFRAAEGRQGELTEAEAKSLKKGISQAQQGMREAVNGPKVVAKGKGRATVQPGAFALVKPAASPGSAPGDSLQLASAEMPAPPSLARARDLPALPAPIPAAVAMPAPALADAPAFGVRPPAPAGPPPAVDPAAPPEVAPLELPDPPTLDLPTIPAPPAPPRAPAPTADPAARPAQAGSPIELPASRPAAPTAEATPPPVLEPSAPSPSPAEPPPASPMPVELPTPSPPPIELPPVGPSSGPIPVEPAPGLPSPPDLAPAQAQDPAPPRVAEASQRPDSSVPARSSTIPEPPPAPEAPPAPARSDDSLPPLPGPSRAGRPDEAGDILSPRLRREVEQIAQRPPADPRQTGGNPVADIGDPNTPMPPPQGSTRLDLPRPPSPTEARPVRRIPIPEEFVPLGKRAWDPNRKFYAAAGTCHMILYFQDPVLERYGQGVEQALGPVGRYFSYPLDDPKQSNQRNQILQPFYSIGKLCFQVGTLPYKLVVDPPWEAEYDLGYYRPGDRIPPDTILITPYGVGPPGVGRKY